MEVKFSPQHQESRKGNLIVVISKDKFPATGPGILTVWQERLAVVEDLELNPGGTVTLTFRPPTVAWMSSPGATPAGMRMWACTG